MHEYYDSSRGYNDIAILRIDGRITRWTDEIVPACLPQRPSYDIVGDITIATGWGSSDLGENV